MSRSKVLAIIPAYNEEACIADTVNELKDLAPDVDFIIVNDGSSDSTHDICRENGYPCLNLSVNCGLTLAFQTGMKYAARQGYQYAVQFDADGQHRPEFISSMLSRLTQDNLDIVIGSRFLTEAKGSSARMLGARLITFIIKMTTGQRISDPTSGFRLYNRRMIEAFSMDSSLNPEPETLARLIRKGASVAEVQVSMRERETGESYLTFSKSISYMMRTCTSILFVQWFR